MRANPILGPAILVLAACGLLLAGCDRKPEKQSVTISGQDGKVTITGNGEHFAMKSDDGKTKVEFNVNGLGTNIRLPSFVPLYHGAKVTSSLTGTDGKGGGGMISFETNDAPANVIAFYKQQAASAGFGENFNMDSGGTMTFASSAKDGKKGMQVVAVKEEGKTRAQVTWSGGN
jgi:hypothetical protein